MRFAGALLAMLGFGSALAAWWWADSLRRWYGARPVYEVQDGELVQTGAMLDSLSAGMAEWASTVIAALVVGLIGVILLRRTRQSVTVDP